MSLLEKIVYIADYIEPGRDRVQNLPEIRKIAFQDLDECMYVILKIPWIIWRRLREKLILQQKMRLLTTKIYIQKGREADSPAGKGL